MIEFTRNPEIGYPAAQYADGTEIPSDYDPGKHKSIYKHNYEAIFDDIADGAVKDREAWKYLILNDLFFIVHVVMGIKKANHPFVVSKCQMVEDGPVDKTVDVWAREHFKMQRLDEPTPTPDGWKLHGDLIVGDEIFGPDGNVCHVTGIGDIVIGHAAYEIEFDDGTKIQCGEEHLWEVWKRTRKRIPGTYKKPGPKRIYREPAVMSTREIYEHGTEIDNRLAVRVSSALVLPEIDLTVDPYVLGVWLGDGTSRTGDITCADQEIYEEIRKRGFEIGNDKSPDSNADTRRIVGLSKLLNELGIRGKGLKRIPDQYLRASVSQRLSLLQGLMDTDGTCDSRGTATFVNINENLIDGIHELLNTLGMKPHKRCCDTKYDGRPYRFYQVSFQAYRCDTPFRLTRKLNNCKNGKSPPRRRFIVNIIPVDPSPMRCIKVDREDGLYLTSRSMVPTHNSVIITQAETVRDILRNPEICHVIFSYKKPKAEDFLFAIKQTLETEFLKGVFPDILFSKPESQSSSWSLQNGITVKRQSASRKEKTVEAYGVIEGMPTGGHWERRIYDDIETADLAKNPDQLKNLVQQYEMSRNLGTMGGTERIIGTFYSHYGLLTYLRDKVDVNGNKMFMSRIIPATHDGTRNGIPVLLTQKQLDDKKTDSTFESQQLCNPTPSSELKLDFNMLKPIEPKLIPRNIYKFMVLDQAGGDETGKKSGDLWSYSCIGVEPCIDEIGQSKVFILDLEAEKYSHSEGIEGFIRMYLRNGIIHQVGVEKVGLSTTEMHISGALRAHGRRLSIDAGNLVHLKHSGRSKEMRVESALQWPLNNGKLYYSTFVNPKYIEGIKDEMAKFPFFHVDILDSIAYVYDMIKEYRFVDARDMYEEDKEQEYEPLGRSAITGY